MAIFRRVRDIMTANLNDLVDCCEDPEKMLRQAVREMDSIFESAVAATAKAVANERLLERQVESERSQAEQWQAFATAQLRKGDENAARRGIVRHAECQKLIAALEDHLMAARAVSSKLRRQVDALRIRLVDARRKQVTYTARKRAAEAQLAAATQLGSFGCESATLNKFDRYCQRIEQAEAEADAMLELTGTGFDDTTLDIEVETELERLKRQVSGT